MRDRLLTVLFVAAAGTVSGGCFDSTTVLRVGGTGAGTLQQRTIVKKAALAQLRALSARGGGGRVSLDPISEEQARALAGSLGPGVALVSSTAINNNDGEGRESTYSFPDVSQLHVNEQPAPPGDVTIHTPGLNTDSAAITLSLTRTPEGNAVLHIVVPPPALFAGPDGAGVVNPAVIQQLQALRVVLAGAHLLVAVEPIGRLVRTSSPYVDGQRVTLLEVDLDRVLGDPTLVSRLQAAKGLDEIRAIVRDAPGLKINLDPEITVEFAPQ